MATFYDVDLNQFETYTTVPKQLKTIDLLLNDFVSLFKIGTCLLLWDIGHHDGTSSLIIANDTD